jgi:antitoxin component YwqK of YwqJK toxin-antitoxin module
MMRKIFYLLFIFLLFNACQNRSVPNQGLEVVSAFSDGSVKIDRRYTTLNGVKTSNYQREFYNDGQLYKEGPLKNEKPDGLWKSYYQNGTLWSEGEFDQGVRNGISRTFHENGSLYYEGTYDHAKKVGLWKFFRPDGSMIKEIDFPKK